MRRFGILGLAFLGVASLGFAPGVHAQSVVGRVASTSGQVLARSAGGERALGCGDPVFAGDTLVTAADSRVGVLMGDVLAQVAPKSSLQVAATDAGAPDATLQTGRVRMIDVRNQGTPAGRLTAGTAQGALSGNDAEAYIFSEKAGEFAMFCEWDSPLAVTRPGQRAVADPGQCVIAKRSEPLYTAPAHRDRIAASGGDYCPPDLGGLASTGPHFSPAMARGVSAPGVPLWSELADSQGAPEILPCDDPGAICSASDGGVIVISEPPPSEDPQPGGGGMFPGSGGGTVNEPPPSTEPQPGGGGPFPGSPEV
jgi:hypothetical protein